MLSSNSARPSDRPRPRPATRIVSHSRTAPAWDARPFPSEETSILVLRALLLTGKRLRPVADRTLDKPYSPRSKALFQANERLPVIPGVSPGLTAATGWHVWLGGADRAGR